MRYDVVIIGGGPSGMMAAGRSGELGARVLLLEKGGGLGTKLLMTGGGRCNITNNTQGPKEMALRYGKAARFMRTSLYEFGPDEVVAFFEGRGVKTKIEEGGRVLPVSNDAGYVLDALVAYLDASNVEVRLGAEVREIVKKNNSIKALILAGGEEVTAGRFLIATGGVSYPASGSTGDGYVFAKAAGHSIIPPRPALTTVIAEGGQADGLKGLSLSGVKVALYKNNKKVAEDTGDVIFTANGLGGPVVMDMSRAVGEALAGQAAPRSGSVELRLDLAASFDFKALERRLIEGLDKAPRRLPEKALEELLPQRLAKAVIEQAGIRGGKKSGEVTRAERKRVAGLLKEFTLRVRKVAGFERAFITAGGVELSQVDPRTMQSRIIENLYLAGEVLDIDGPTGGYNLQVSWSTGYVAGTATARR